MNLGTRAAPDLSASATTTAAADAARPALVSAASRRIGWSVGAGALAAFVAVGPSNFTLHSDAPSFLRVARAPFGTGRGFPTPLGLGVAYRYGRILYPLVAWLGALGRPGAVPWALAAVYVASVAVWFATTAEHLRRGGRSPRLALWLLAAPFALIFVLSPVVAAEPMAGALILLAYLFAARDDGHARALTLVCAAAAILTREMTAVAFVPLVWDAWRRERISGLSRWALAALPYAAWATWVRWRVGFFPFLDPASTRRGAFSVPFAGWLQTLRDHPRGGDLLGLAIGASTLIVVAVLVARRRWTSPLSQAAIVSGAFVACYGHAVWQSPTEAVRVIAPAQVLLFIALLTERSSRATPEHRPG